jgi:hypothetical protein
MIHFPFRCHISGGDLNQPDASMQILYILEWMLFQYPSAHPFGQNCSPTILPRRHICWDGSKGFDVPSHGLENEKTALFQGCIPRFGSLPLIRMSAVLRELLLRLLGETVWRYLLLLGGLLLRLLLAVGRYAHSYKQHRAD